jgi:hypothetical protein
MLGERTRADYAWMLFMTARLFCQVRDVHPHVVRLQLLHRDVTGEGDEFDQHVLVRTQGLGRKVRGSAVEYERFACVGQAHITHEADVHGNLLSRAL